MKIGRITVSDRASAGIYEDRSGPEIERILRQLFGDTTQFCAAVVPDEAAGISAALREMADREQCEVILTTGGTGITARDVTPEATRAVLDRELPGFGEVMRAESMKITRNAILSRNLAAVVDRTLVICLPGKPSGAVECLGFVVGAIPHCVEVLQEVPTSC